MTRRYLTRRLLQVLPLLAALLVLTFVLVHFTGADPALEFAGEGADQSQIDAARSYLGVDKPLAEQFASYAGRLAQGDFGDSYVQRRPVTAVIGRRLAATLLLMGTALGVSTTAGISLGVFAARRAGRRGDAAVNVSVLVAYSLPAFWLAQLSILTFVLRLGLLPSGGMTDARAGYTGVAATVDVARHLVLPALVLSVSEFALVARIARSSLLAQSGTDYLRAARAKGVGERLLLKHHALPNALLPVVTVIGSRAGFLLSGAVLIETVFAWPGLGRLLVESAQAGDRPVILGMVLLVAVAVVVANLVTDLVYAAVDPRIRYA